MIRWLSNRRLAWASAVAYLLLIFIISHGSIRRLSLPTFSFADKIMHAVAYALLSLLLCWAFRTSRSPWLCRWAAVLALVVASLYGITDEWHQNWSPGGREADLWDWVADTVGAAAGALAVLAYFRIRKKPWQKQDESWA